jgi:hypothetical protein
MISSSAKLLGSCANRFETCIAGIDKAVATAAATALFG